MDFTRIITLLVLLLVPIIFFSIAFSLNKKTPMPKELELYSLGCGHCQDSSCSFSEPNRVEKMKTEILADMNKTKI